MAGSENAIDVLLVNPGSRAAVYQQLGDRYSASEPPSLAGLFATYLRKRGLSVAIVDAPAFNLSPVGVAETIRACSGGTRPSYVPLFARLSLSISCDKFTKSTSQLPWTCLKLRSTSGATT